MQKILSVLLVLFSSTAIAATPDLSACGIKLVAHPPGGKSCLAVQKIGDSAPFSLAFRDQGSVKAEILIVTGKCPVIKGSSNMPADINNLSKLPKTAAGLPMVMKYANDIYCEGSKIKVDYR